MFTGAALLLMLGVTLFSVVMKPSTALVYSCRMKPGLDRETIILALRRPGSLAEVARWTGSWEEFFPHLWDLLDQFSIERRPEMLAEEPPRLAGSIDDGDVADAYLAAVAVALSRSAGVIPPAWTRGTGRALRSPWFAHPGEALRATLILESPASFRERNLFVSENALSRA